MPKNWITKLFSGFKTNLESLLHPRPPLSPNPATNEWAEVHYQASKNKIYVQTDRLFAGLMVFQWILGIAFALVLSPKNWTGELSGTHIHVWTSIILGGIIVSLPIGLGVFYSGHSITRHVIAASQMLMSALLIHLSGGRIETHFHIFGSLAFLAFYRNSYVLLTGTLVVTLDHLLRGYYWPQSVFGVLNADSWRWLEHAGWVVFEDVFLIYSCIRGNHELWETSNRRAELETVNSLVEAEVLLRTTELTISNQELQVQRMNSIESSKMAALGEMSAGLAHEVNNPLAIIHGKAGQLKQMLKLGNLDLNRIESIVDKIESTSMRISKIIGALRSFARDGALDPFQTYSVQSIIEDTLEFCQERFKSQSIEIRLPAMIHDLKIECRPVQISQVLLNLLNNSYDAVEALEERWLEFEVIDRGHEVEIAIKDSGPGISTAIQDKVFQPFFTTKLLGKGTGLGLSISIGIVGSHNGKLILDKESKNTRFVIHLPKVHGVKNSAS
jgi:two-component system sensor histidine kinase HydH